MARDIQEPTRDERGAEHHPAFALIGASRVQSSGSVLFDSDVVHRHTVVVRLWAAKRDRDLHRDHLWADRQLFEVEMSEAQWASFVSSMNVGDGVACTLRHNGTDWDVPSLPYQPRLQETMNEVRGKAEEAAQKVADAFAAYEAKKNAANLDRLRYAIQNMPANITFAAESLSEHAEAVVQKARADVEAMVVTKARQLGLEPSDLGTLALAPVDENRP